MASEAAPYTFVPPSNQKGEYVRKASTFRDQITADGSSGFRTERDRYHLYVSLACPWAHRVLIVRKLKGLEDVLPYTVMDWYMAEGGWKFTDQKRGCTLDTVNNCSYLREVYKIANPDYSLNITVPVLWDKKQKTIVNNESSEIIRMLNHAFNEFCPTAAQRDLDLYPEAKRAEIDAINEWVYPNINNGVYRSGFAKSQEAYTAAVVSLFDALDKVEGILSRQRYLTGSTVTEADIRLFTTLVRFDMVYVGHFKCNKRKLIEYPNLWAYTRDVYQIPGVAETVDMEHIAYHYQMSHTSINPLRIVAIGPDLNFGEPHGRENV